MFVLKRQVFLYFRCNYVLIQCVKVKQEVTKESSPPHPHILSHATLYRLLLIFTAFPELFLSQPCYISQLGLPPNGKQLVWGLPRAHYAQFFFESPIYLSCPVSSLAPCPHLGGATQLKQKKNSFYENMFLAHIWYCAASPPFPHFVSQHDSPAIHWCCAEVCIGWLKTDIKSQALWRSGNGVNWESGSHSRCGSPAVLWV